MPAETQVGAINGIYTKDEKPSPEKEAILDKMSRIEMVNKVLTGTYNSVLGELSKKYKVKLYTFSTHLINREISDITKIKAAATGLRLEMPSPMLSRPSRKNLLPASSSFQMAEQYRRRPPEQHPIAGDNTHYLDHCGRQYAGRKGYRTPETPGTARGGRK